MKKILIILILISIVGCRNDQQKADQATKFKIADTLTITNPSNNHFMSFNSMVSGDTLIQMNYANRNGFNLFNLKNKNFIREINLENGGPNGVGLTQAFYYKSMDSLYLFNQTQIVQIDDNKQITKIFDVKGDYDKLWYPINVSNGAEAFTFDNKLFFGKNDFEKMTSNRYYQADLLMSFDLTTKERKQYNINFPDTYLDKCWQMNQADFSYAKHLNDTGKVVFSFCANENLFIFDITKNKITSVKKLDYPDIDEIESINCEDTKYPSRERQHYLEQPNFKYLIADKHRNVYYRLIKKEINEADAAKYKNQTRKALYRSDYILQVLDQEFQPIAQQELKSPNFLVHDFFVAKDGLYISLNNPLKADFDENTLTYAKFNLKY